MKKKIITLITALILALSVLVGCSGYSKVKVSKEFELTKDDYEYTVRSNGGNAVQYGQYVYFINGYRGYDDTDGKNNVFGKVVKGALYRAKLVGVKEDRDFTVDFDKDTGLNFVSKKGKVHAYLGTDATEDDEEVDIVDVQLVAPKVIGTSGYTKGGGIYIYDEYVYYASPNNTKNKSGTVQVNKTDFFRTKLDGSKTQLLFTTEEDAADKPYAFYKQGDSVFLVCYYGTKIVSVKVTGDKKPGKAMLLTDDATSVLFPVKDTYNSKENVTNSLEDFIYYTRAVTEDDLQRAGNVVVVMRPDGSERFNFLMNGETVTLESVSGDALFYRTTDVNGNTSIIMDNLHDVLMDEGVDENGKEYKNSPSYKAYEDEIKKEDETKARFQVTSTILTSTSMSDYTSLYCFRDNIYTNVGYIIALRSSTVELISNGSQNYRILNEMATLEFIQGNYMYYMDSDGTTLKRIDFTSAGNESETIAKSVNTGGLGADYVAGMVMYFGKVDDWADGYAFFKNVGVEGAEAVAVYDRAVADRKVVEDETEDATDSE